MNGRSSGAAAVGTLVSRQQVPRAGSQASARAGLPGPFQSILYRNVEAAEGLPREVPTYFRDLNLDQVVDAITANKAEYDLKPFFHAPLSTVDAISYRHEVMRDIDDDRTLRCITSFAEKMRRMREQSRLANKLYYDLQQQRWFLQAAATYCAAIRELESDLAGLPIASFGLLGFRDYVVRYAAGAAFSDLAATVGRLLEDLGSIAYCILVKEGAFKVRKYTGEPDYSAEIAETFKKFQQGAAEEYRVNFDEPAEMNHIEAKILEFVARLHPEIFSRVAAFRTEHAGFADPAINRFDREIQFYVSYKEYMVALERAGLQFCYPVVSAGDKEEHNEAGFDLALATRLVRENTPVVRNDWQLTGPERIIVVSGPNQGGKTTFARMFGQLHHMASIGCPVPGRRARLFLFDALFVHFEREENIKNLRGKLQDDLVRMHDILGRATASSVIIMNEIFTSTALHDAVLLARNVIDSIIELDCLCVCVTFLDELSGLNEKTVSMVSTVVPDNPATRTYRVVRRPSDGRSYAISIAEKYRVTYDALKARIPE